MHVVQARTTGRRWPGLVLAVVIAVAPQGATADNDEEGRPWARGTWAVGPVLGLGFSRDVTNLEFGAGGEYYILNGWSFGASLSDRIYIYSSSLKAQFPGVSDQLATNALFLIPKTRYVFYRSYRFSPWALAGLGPVFFNHGGGTVGKWVAGPGAYIGLAGPVYLTLGVMFSSLFPRGQCQSAFDYVADDGMTRVQFELGEGIGSLCGFNWTPQIGLAFAPRGTTRKERREHKRRERQRRGPPPPHPLHVTPVPVQPPPPPKPETPVAEEPSTPDDDDGPEPPEDATVPAEPGEPEAPADDVPDDVPADEELGAEPPGDDVPPADDPG